MCCRRMCGYSITWKPRSNVCAASGRGRARRGTRPVGASAAARTWNRTVCDSSSRVNSPSARPASPSSPAAPRASRRSRCALRIVDDRDADLARVGSARRRVPAAPAPAPRPAARAARRGRRPRPAAGRVRRSAAPAHGGRDRHDRDLRRDAHRQRRHDEQLGSLLAAEDVALVAVLHRQRRRSLPSPSGRSSASPARRTASAGTAGRTARRRRTCSGPASPSRCQYGSVIRAVGGNRQRRLAAADLILCRAWTSASRRRRHRGAPPRRDRLGDRRRSACTRASPSKPSNAHLL